MDDKIFPKEEYCMFNNEQWYCQYNLNPNIVAANSYQNSIPNYMQNQYVKQPLWNEMQPINYDISMPYMQTENSVASNMSNQFAHASDYYYNNANTNTHTNGTNTTTHGNHVVNHTSASENLPNGSQNFAQFDTSMTHGTTFPYPLHLESTFDKPSVDFINAIKNAFNEFRCDIVPINHITLPTKSETEIDEIISYMRTFAIKFIKFVMNLPGKLININFLRN